MTYEQAKEAYLRQSEIIFKHKVSGEEIRYKKIIGVERKSINGQVMERVKLLDFNENSFIIAAPETLTEA